VSSVAGAVSAGTPRSTFVQRLRGSASESRAGEGLAPGPGSVSMLGASASAVISAAVAVSAATAAPLAAAAAMLGPLTPRATPSAGRSVRPVERDADPVLTRYGTPSVQRLLADAHVVTPGAHEYGAGPSLSPPAPAQPADMSAAADELVASALRSAHMRPSTAASAGASLGGAGSPRPLRVALIQRPMTAASAPDSARPLSASLTAPLIGFDESPRSARSLQARGLLSSGRSYSIPMDAADTADAALWPQRPDSAPGLLLRRRDAPLPAYEPAPSPSPSMPRPGSRPSTPGVQLDGRQRVRLM
jgi:hypothetical protein